MTLPTMKTKVTKIDNHWSLISLNINGLTSLIKRYRLTDWIKTITTTTKNKKKTESSIVRGGVGHVLSPGSRPPG